MFARYRRGLMFLKGCVQLRKDKLARANLVGILAGWS